MEPEKKKLTLSAARESLEIFEFVRPYKVQFVLGLVFLFLSSVVFMAVVQLPGIMVDIAHLNHARAMLEHAAEYPEFA